VPYPQSAPLFGEIYYVDFNPARGREQAGRRPAVIISRVEANRALAVVTVAAVSTGGANLPPAATRVFLPAGAPLQRDSQVLAFQIMAVDKSRLDSYEGMLDPVQQEQLKAALRVSWNL
jgi:mRNA interferase MazF